MSGRMAGHLFFYLLPPPWPPPENPPPPPKEELPPKPLTLSAVRAAEMPRIMEVE